MMENGSHWVLQARRGWKKAFGLASDVPEVDDDSKRGNIIEFTNGSEKVDRTIRLRHGHEICVGVSAKYFATAAGMVSAIS